MSGNSRSFPLIRHRYLALLLLGAFMFLPFLGTRDLWYPDEPDIGEVVKAMYESGDWIAPRRNGIIWVDYPPMLYWVGTASSHLLGGMSEYALRFPNALAAIALALVTCAAASRFFDPRTGLWAGFLMLTFQQFAYQAVCYRPDVLFALWIGAGLFLYAEGAGQKPRWYLRVAAFACLGLAMLAKGPLGLLLPGLVLTLWHGSRREWRRILELAPLALVAMAVYLPWFVACGHAMGVDSILYELYAQNLERFVSGGRGHGQPIYYYLINIWLDLWPFFPLFPFALFWTWRTGRLQEPRTQLALWWLGAFFAFLSIAVTKRQLYLLPAYPAAAVLLAPYLARLGRSSDSAEDAPKARPARIYLAAMAVAFLLFAVLFLGAVAAFEPLVAKAELDERKLAVAHELQMPLVGLAVVFLASALLVGDAWRRKDVQAGLLRVGLVQVPLLIVVLVWVFPPWEPLKSYREPCQWIRQEIAPDETHIGLVSPRYAHRKKGGFGYYGEVLVAVMETPTEVERFLQERPGSVVVIDSRGVDDIFADDEDRWRSRVLREIWVARTHYLVVQ